MERIKIANTDPEIEGCFPVMVQLRPQVDKDSFVERIRRQMTNGYQLAFVESQGLVVGVAGFRVYENLWLGKFLYVDDLVADERNRSKGVGKRLFRWLTDFARANGCSHLELDSGVQRFGAHRFYLREGMDISDHHFSLKL